MNKQGIIFVPCDDGVTRGYKDGKLVGTIRGFDAGAEFDTTFGSPAVPTTDAESQPEREPEPTGVGVLVIKNGRVLTGVRKSGVCPFTICGPGGSIEHGETAEQAAIRETQEEFGITPTVLVPLSVRSGLASEFGVPQYFLCVDFTGKVRTADRSEIVAPQWSELGAVLELVSNRSAVLFPPFADSVHVLNEFLTSFANSQKTIAKSQETGYNGAEDGGPGSGRYPKGSRHNPFRDEYVKNGKEAIESALKSGKIKMALKAGAQSKHREGSPRYKKATAKGQRVSTVSISDEEIASIVNAKTGTGKVYRNRKTGTLKEVIDCGKVVGTYVSAKGKKHETTRLTVHHSKNGYHVVPASSRGGGKS